MATRLLLAGRPSYLRLTALNSQTLQVFFARTFCSSSEGAKYYLEPKKQSNRFSNPKLTVRSSCRMIFRKRSIHSMLWYQRFCSPNATFVLALSFELF